MKITIKLILFVLIHLVIKNDSSAQIFLDSGIYTIGGSAGFSKQSNENNNYEINNLRFNLLPNFSYFINEFIEFGGGAGFAYQNQKYEYKNKSYSKYNYEYNDRNLFLNTAFNYYVLKVPLPVFIGTSMDINYYSYNEGNGRYIYYSFYCGSLFFFSERTAIVSKLYIENYDENKNGNKGSELGISFGFRYFIIQNE